MLTIPAMGNGVKGLLSNAKGEPLPYATIYVHQIKSGTSTNQDGYFEIKLNPGEYDITFQYMGYETALKHIEVGSTFKIVNVVLAENSILLKSAVVYGGKEDPAYTLMRKAIAKAPFHLQELDSYSAEVYIKGSGRILDAPFLIRKALEKEGVDSNMAFTSETVMEVDYTRPNIYKQNVISTRTSGSDDNSPQNRFIFSSFYQENIAGIVSPLSRKAFAYYKFKYIESFTDRGYTINKIQVIPRSRGDGVLEGFIYLVENDWNLYRINFVTYIEGFKVEIRGVYVPVEEKIWLPVTLKFDGTGKYFGVQFAYKYLATIGKYEWKVNPDLDFDIEIIDEKIDKEVAKEIERLDKEVEKNETASISDKKDAKVTRKQLKKLLKEYEEKQDEVVEDKNVVIDYNYTVDSLANKKDSTYWESVRSVPLDSHEVRGYQKLDSLMVAEKEKAALDSTKESTFSPFELFTGYTFKFNDTSSLRVIIPVNFNTVDGLLVGLRLRYRYKFSDTNMFQLSGETHYGFSRTTLYGQATASYNYRNDTRMGSIAISGGKMGSQYNHNNPIEPILNTFTTLFMEDNFMKLYQNEYLKLGWSQDVGEKWNVQLSTEYSQRTHLDNTTDFTFIKYHNRAYTSNRPENEEYMGYLASVSQSSRLIINSKLFVRPWQKTAIKNGEKRLIRSSSPTFWVDFNSGFSTNESMSNYFGLSFGYMHYLKVKGARRLRINSFFGYRDVGGQMSQVDFIDFAHFMGNQSPIVNSNPATQYRMLPYYSNSTNGAYASVLLNYEFRKLALTQFLFVRMTGIKENLFANYLWTDYANFNYYELGYSIDNIYRIFRVEVVTNNLNGPFNDWAIRFGVTTNFGDN